MILEHAAATENMKQISKKLLYFYERWMWYVSIATGEFDKPLNIIKYVSYGAIVFKLFGANFSIWWVIGISGIGLIFAGLTGIWLVKAGIVQYVQKLNNSQNAELLRILKHTAPGNIEPLEIDPEAKEMIKRMEAAGMTDIHYEAPPMQ